MGIDFDFDIRDGKIGATAEFGDKRFSAEVGWIADQFLLGVESRAFVGDYGVRYGYGVDVFPVPGLGHNLGIYTPDKSGGEPNYIPANPLEMIVQETLAPRSTNGGLHSTGEIPLQDKYGADSWIPTADGARRYPDGTIFYPDGRQVKEGDRPNQNPIPIEPEGTPDRPGLPQDMDREHPGVPLPTTEPEQPKPFVPDPNDPFRPTQPIEENNPYRVKLTLTRKR